MAARDDRLAAANARTPPCAKRGTPRYSHESQRAERRQAQLSDGDDGAHRQQVSGSGGESKRLGEAAGERARGEPDCRVDPLEPPISLTSLPFSARPSDSFLSTSSSTSVVEDAHFLFSLLSAAHQASCLLRSPSCSISRAPSTATAVGSPVPHMGNAANSSCASASSVSSGVAKKSAWAARPPATQDRFCRASVHSALRRLSLSS
jgi:hypothetical protein